MFTIQNRPLGRLLDEPLFHVKQHIVTAGEAGGRVTDIEI